MTCAQQIHVTKHVDKKTNNQHKNGDYNILQV